MIDWTDWEDVSVEAELLASLALVIDEAVSQGAYTINMYAGAISVLYERLDAHSKKISQLFAAEVEANRDVAGENSTGDVKDSL